MFEIKILTKNDGEFTLKNLTEKETCEILAEAYECIAKEKEYITFKNRLVIEAVDLEAFYVL